MNKLKTIIDLVNQGDKAKLWKYLNKGIYSKKDKIDVVKSKGVGDAPSGGSDAEYIVTEELNTELGPAMASLSISTKYKLEQGGVEATLITSSLLWAQYGRQKCKAIKFSKKEKFSIVAGMDGNTPIIQVMSALEALNFSFGGDVEPLIDALPRITEEQFYNIES